MGSLPKILAWGKENHIIFLGKGGKNDARMGQSSNNFQIQQKQVSFQLQTKIFKHGKLWMKLILLSKMFCQ